MTTAFVVLGRGGREVTRAKKDMSAFMRGQGRVPFRPIPSLGWAFWVDVDDGWWGIGVVATMRVRGVDREGILVLGFSIGL